MWRIESEPSGDHSTVSEVVDAAIPQGWARKTDYDEGGRAFLKVIPNLANCSLRVV